MEIEILKMTLQDFEKIKDILHTEFDEFWTPEILKDEISGENKIYIVAKKDSEIIGFAGCMINFPEAEIMNIVTKKNKRGQGIGNALLNKMIEIAETNQVKEIFLEVNEKNKIARKMYENTGFQEISRRKKYYHSVDDAIIMLKKTKYFVKKH